MALQTAGTILIVDDEPSFRSVLSGLLRRQGYTVVTAGNGALELEQLPAQRYDVILCDILMPEMDGQAFYTRLQLGYPALCSRVIFLTGDILRDTTTAFLHQYGTSSRRCWAPQRRASSERCRGLMASAGPPTSPASIPFGGWAKNPFCGTPCPWRGSGKK